MGTADKRRFILHFLMAILIVVTLVILFVQHENIKDYNNTIQYYVEEVKKTRNNDKNYTHSKVSQNFDRTEPNIDTAENSSKRRIANAISLAYNHCQYPSRFNANQNRIKQELGNEFGKTVLNNVKPQSNTNYKGNQSIANHMTMMKIGFGKFNTVSKTLPVNVIVSYRTPKFKNVKRSYIESSVFQLSYQPKNAYSNQFTIDHFDSGKNNWNRIFK